MSKKRETIGEVVDSYVIAAILALPTVALLYYAFDAGVCTALKLTTVPPARLMYQVSLLD